MLKPQRQHDHTLHEFPPVFGKPWYWHRTTSTMDSTRSLAHVIMEMREEINKLESENRALREEYSQDSFGDVPGEPSPMSPAAELRMGIENPYANLRRNASAPALEGQFKENTTMTVRRYSISSKMPGVSGRDGMTDNSKRSDSSWGRLQEEVKRGSSTKFEREKLGNKHSLQEYVHNNRAKVKTVTFLLPVDDIYTNRPVLTKHQEGHRTTELDSITETDY